MSVDSLATNPICHARIKHLEIDLYFIRDKVFNKTYKSNICHCDQLVDCLTKSLCFYSTLVSQVQIQCNKVSLSLEGVVKKDIEIHISTPIHQYPTMSHPCCY